MVRTISKEVQGLVGESVATGLMRQFSQLSGELKDLIQACRDGESEDLIETLLLPIKRRERGDSLGRIIFFVKQHVPDPYHQVLDRLSS